MPVYQGPWTASQMDEDLTVVHWGMNMMESLKGIVKGMMMAIE